MEKTYLTHEAPGKGTYKCMQCDYTIDLEDGEELPTCPWCGWEVYIKISD